MYNPFLDTHFLDTATYLSYLSIPIPGDLTWTRLGGASENRSTEAGPRFGQELQV
jgi:hypothetical protein